MTALLEYIDLILSDTDHAKPINKGVSWKPLETPNWSTPACTTSSFIIADINHMRNEKKASSRSH